MTRSSGRFCLRGRTALLALVIGCASALVASPAAAKKKKAPAPATDTEAPAEAGQAPAEKPAPAAPQASDTEKPKAILDVSQDAPKTDNLGHIHFATPGTEGVGRVAVKAAPNQQIKVFLEGRYFGLAPITIYSVPKGDYILEAVHADGKQVARPVSVGENEEVAVDLRDIKPREGGREGGLLNAEMTSRRMHWTVAFLAVTAVGVAGAVTFGILELKDESDYNNVAATDPHYDQRRTDISNRGNRDALLTNVGIGVAAAGLIGAVIAGYPLVFKSSASEKKMAAVMVTPTVAPTGAGGVLTLRF